MEGTESSCFVVSEITERKILRDIEENNFNSLIEEMGLFDKEAISKQYLDKTEVADLKGEALYNLGMALSHDKKATKEQRELIKQYHIEQNLEKAISCFYQSLKCGYGEAANKLFTFFYHQNSEFKDYGKAFQIAQVGIELFNANSYFNMGRMFYEGNGVQQDYRKAREYFEVSFDENPKHGGYELGVIYERALGVKKDTEKALDYFSIAAECDDKYSLFKLGVIYSGFYKYKYQDVEKNPVIATECLNKYLRKSAPDKRTNALIRLGEIGCESKKQKDKTAGLRKLIRVARKGNDEAKEYLREQTAFGELQTEQKPIDVASFIA